MPVGEALARLPPEALERVPAAVRAGVLALDAPVGGAGAHDRARTPSELERRPRAVAIGTFDGVHLGHRAVVRAAVDAGLERRPS